MKSQTILDRATIKEPQISKKSSSTKKNTRELRNSASISEVDNRRSEDWSPSTFCGKSLVPTCKHHEWKRIRSLVLPDSVSSEPGASNHLFKSVSPLRVKIPQDEDFQLSGT
ncbi:hypothetical protein RF11_09590 [Thelohanellus kitauei]|uniref:Uncharacterized protein n=1 Tax=Thelohanellus kitauei TaxID=669202 RepID=A0A0C2IZN8_THEKT|nr:hypothetical protein RF11_09590 [Thelohanellus kitauei]